MIVASKSRNQYLQREVSLRMAVLLEVLKPRTRKIITQKDAKALPSLTRCNMISPTPLSPVMKYFQRMMF